MKKSKTRILRYLLLMISGIFLFVTNVYGKENAPTGPGELYAQSAVLMDGASGRVLYEKNGEEPRPMASTTKIMTCILVLEQCNLEDICETSSYAASMPKVHLGAQKGETFYVKDLLYSLMLESHNDSAVILAEHAAGSVSAFAEKMNEKARELGCEDTCFLTPNGLDQTEEATQREHHTTARDLAKIMCYCIEQSPKKELFLEITKASSYEFSDIEGKQSFVCYNHNAFLSMMEGALSGKTGFTAKAGYCYIGSLRRDGKTLIVALLGCGWPNNKGYKWQDTRKLMEYGLKNYTLHSLCEAQLPEIPETIPVEEGQSENVGAAATVGVKRVEGEDVKLLLGPQDKVKTIYRGKTTLTAPVKKGEKIGELQYLVNEEVWKTEDLVATEQVKKRDYKWCLEQISGILIGKNGKKGEIL